MWAASLGGHELGVSQAPARAAFVMLQMKEWTLAHGTEHNAIDAIRVFAHAPPLGAGERKPFTL
jgi:hypothetical protein